MTRSDTGDEQGALRLSSSSPDQGYERLRRRWARYQDEGTPVGEWSGYGRFNGDPDTTARREDARNVDVFRGEGQQARCRARLRAVVSMRWCWRRCRSCGEAQSCRGRRCSGADGRLLVVDVVDLVHAERADTPPSEAATTTSTAARAVVALRARTLAFASLGLFGWLVSSATASLTTFTYPPIPLFKGTSSGSKSPPLGNPIPPLSGNCAPCARSRRGTWSATTSVLNRFCPSCPSQLRWTDGLLHILCGPSGRTDRETLPAC